MGRCQGSCVGNWAISDLVTALNMLSNIIESFGGDRNSITLLGWGSGASLVIFLRIAVERSVFGKTDDENALLYKCNAVKKKD